MKRLRESSWAGRKPAQQQPSRVTLPRAPLGVQEPARRLLQSFTCTCPPVPGKRAVRSQISAGWRRRSPRCAMWRRASRKSRHRGHSLWPRGRAASFAASAAASAAKSPTESASIRAREASASGRARRDRASPGVVDENGKPRLAALVRSSHLLVALVDDERLRLAANYGLVHHDLADVVHGRQVVHRIQ